MSRVVWAKSALTACGWQRDVSVRIASDGRIRSVTADTAPGGERADVLLPAPVNLHSHAFQRALAGRTEGSGSADFWTWRDAMYGLVERLTPDDVESIARLAQIEMLEAGFASVAEFHYLHHAPGGIAYANPAETCERVAAAAAETGIGLTLLPVLYERGGCDGRPAEGGQLRFACTPDRFDRIAVDARRMVSGAAADWRFGVAPHSLRAVGPDGIRRLDSAAPDLPIHIHAAEQAREVDEVAATFGAPPVRWLLDHASVDRRWCLIHCTATRPDEVRDLAASGAVAGLCPITEADLGDGVFACDAFLSGGGAFGIGTDSNVRVSLAGELRQLEYGQRLRDRARARLVRPGASVGRTLFDRILAAGCRAGDRDAGAIESGRWADLFSLNGDSARLAGTHGDGILDAFVFAGGDRAVDKVWSAGRKVVSGGRHVARDEIAHAYRKTLAGLGWRP